LSLPLAVICVFVVASVSVFSLLLPLAVICVSVAPVLPFLLLSCFLTLPLLSRWRWIGGCDLAPHTPAPGVTTPATRRPRGRTGVCRTATIGASIVTAPLNRLDCMTTLIAQCAHCACLAHIYYKLVWSPIIFQVL
jgi:hypothetical protein